jgi:molybdopterin-biosynthesis enzyme MoeA-like protein
MSWKTYLSWRGFPRIMRGMLDHVMSMMEKGTPYISNTISCMLLEGQIAEDLARLQSKYTAVNMGSYPHYRSGVLGLSFVLRGIDRQMVQQATDDVIAMIRHHGDEPRAISIQSK